MAAVSQSPNALNPINRGGKWILTQAPTSPPIETRLAWEVLVDGNKVSEGTEKTTSGSDEVVVDPRDDLIGFLLHQLPGLTPRSVYQKDDELIIGVSINYGTKEIDASSEPVQKTINVGSSDGPYDFINANISVIDGDVLNSAASAVWLSHHPDKVQTHPYAYGWIYLYGTSGINLNWRNCDGTTGSDTMSAPFTVNAIPTGAKNLNLPENVCWYSLEFVALGRTIEFEVYCAPENQCGNLIFLEPIGGISNHAFTEVSHGGSVSSQVVQKHYEPDSDYDTWASYGGSSVLQSVASPAVSMSMRIRPDDRYRNFINQMLGSSLAFIQGKDNAGNVVFQKANINGASMSGLGPDGYAILSVSASMLHDIVGHKSVY